MSTAYYHVKKRRALKRRRISSFSDDDSQHSSTSDRAVPLKVQRLAPDNTTAPENLNQASSSAAVSPNLRLSPDRFDFSVKSDSFNDQSFSDSISNAGTTRDTVTDCNDDPDNNSCESSEVNDCVDAEDRSSPVDLVESSSAPAITLKDKIRTWTLKNIGTLKNTVVSELLCILRSEGYVTLPKTAAALLNTKSNFIVQPMLSCKKTTGSYVYFGIQCGLKKRISPATFKEDKIRVLVSIDGIPIYRNSQQQFWPILIQVYDKKYACRPMVVALYLGDAKPDSADEYLNDFVQEANTLMAEGLTISNKKYTFEIAAFVCDTPARAFIKSCKSHTGFYGCERCEVKGVTVESHRVYCQTDCERRTEESFRNKRQPQHHLDNCISPLSLLMNFDPVSQVVLDELHLLHLGAMKALLEKWLKENKSVPLHLRILLQTLLDSVSSSVPKEFQRKKFVLKYRSNWKATQYRFFLLCCGPVILRHILPEDKYRHFLLLSTACRVLGSEELAVRYSEYAGELLLQYFNLMPTLYGRGSQVMNCHNLIHLADDVKRMKAPLSHYSAYPFENCLGFLRKLVRTPHKPLVQVARRLTELEAGRDMVVRPHPLISGCVPKNDINMAKATKLDRNYFQQIEVKGVTVSVVKPDNVVKLMNGDIVEVRSIFCNESDAEMKTKDVRLRGLVMKNIGNLFTYPCASSFVGIEQVKLPSRARDTTFSVTDIKSKCILLEAGNKICSITLLHM